MTAKNDDFLWKFKSKDKIQNWPTSDFQRYISQPTELFPKQFLKHKNIHVPQKLPINILDNAEIIASAYSKHGSKYFVSHMGEEFITLIVMLNGLYCAKVGNKTYEINKNQIFILPAHTPCDYFTRGKKFELIWFHIKNTTKWNSTLGKGIICRDMKYFDKFLTVYNLYADELYQKTPSLTFLQNSLELILETLRKEFCVDAETMECKKYQELAKTVAKNLDKNWSTELASKMLNTTTPMLNIAFQNMFSVTFPKYVLRLRMDVALRMLLNGKRLADIAKKTGFSTPYALSATFKKYYGVSPKKRKELEKNNRG